MAILTLFSSCEMRIFGEFETVVRQKGQSKILGPTYLHNKIQAEPMTVPLCTGLKEDFWCNHFGAFCM